MRRLLTSAILVAVLLVGGPVWAQEEPIAHLLLMDVSGSLRARGYAVKQGNSVVWTDTIPSLAERLLQPGGDFFKPESQLYIQPFSDAATDLKERRVALGPFPLSEAPSLRSRLPVPGAGATDMDRALTMAEALAARSGAKTVFTWLITDNENNLHSNQSDAKFYERLRGSPAYDHVYFFPLAKPEEGENHPLVMYLLVHHTEEPDPWVDKLVEEVVERIGFEGVLFRPLYSGGDSSVLKIDRSLEFEGPKSVKVSQEGGATKLSIDEGDRLSGRLQFKIASQLKGWEIVDGNLEDAAVSFEVPSVYKNSGKVSLKTPVTPRQLNVKPKQKSIDVHVVSLANSDLKVERPWSEKFADPFAKFLPPIEGRLKMKATLNLNPGSLEDSPIRPNLSDEMRKRVASVPNLNEIEQFMVFQLDEGGGEDGIRTIEFERKLLLEVRASSLPRVLIMLVLGGGTLLLAFLVWFFLLWRRELTLEAPDGQHALTMGNAYSNYAVISPTGEVLAQLQCRFGALQIVPEPSCLIDGEEMATEVRFEGSEFPFMIGFDHKDETHHFVLHQAASGSGGGGAAEAAPEL